MRDVREMRAARSVRGVEARRSKARRSGDSIGFDCCERVIGDRWGGPPAGRFYAPSR